MDRATERIVVTKSSWFEILQLFRLKPYHAVDEYRLLSGFVFPLVSVEKVANRVSVPAEFLVYAIDKSIAAWVQVALCRTLLLWLHFHPLGWLGPPGLSICPRNLVAARLPFDSSKGLVEGSLVEVAAGV